MTEGQALVLAEKGCSLCFGLGMVQLQRGKARVCACVWRRVFRICFRRFRGIIEQTELTGGSALQRVTHAFVAGPSGNRVRVRTLSSRTYINEEYCADLILLARRALRADPQLYKLFRFHFLLGADWRMCAPRLGLDRGQFFHAVYRVEERLGRAFSETAPYGLYPLDEYFGGRCGSLKTIPASEAVTPCSAGKPGEGARSDMRRTPLRAPIARSSSAA